MGIGGETLPAPTIGRVMAKATSILATTAGLALGMVATGLMTATVAGAAPPPRPKTDQKQQVFIQYLVDHGVPYTSVPDAVSLAHSTCGILGTDSPTRIQDAATAIQHSVDMRPEQMQLFAGAATTVYCPSVKIS